MKKILGVLALSVFVGTGAFAQTTPSFSTVQTGFQSFAGDVASSLPYASNIGLNWSWSYIGNLPHFGVGLAAGFVTIPTKGFNDVVTSLGLGSNVLPAPLNNPNLGLPLPAYVAEARLGGIILPFDIGIKAGFIPKQVNLAAILPTGMNLDFHLYGAQLRYELVKEKTLMPSVSVGVGVNHFDGTIGMTLGQTIPISSVSAGSTTYNIALSAPQLSFNWNSNSLDANIQVSKKILLLLTPYIGAGLSYGFSTAGGGLNSQLLINGVPATQTQINQINQALTLTGGQTINFSSTGFNIGSKANGFSARAYAGTSINLWFLKLDVTGMYNVMSNKLGLTVGARAQF